MMKTTKIKQSIVAFACLLVLICFSSCKEEEYGIIKSENTKVRISLNTGQLQQATSRAADNIGDDDYIGRVYYFIFAGDNLERKAAIDARIFTVEVLSGAKKLYVVANYSDAVKTHLDGVTSVTALKQLLADEISDPITADNDGKLPALLMAGETTFTATPADTSKITINLQRAFARIDLQLAKFNDNDIIEITDIELIRNKKKTTIWEGQPLASNDVYDVAITGSLELTTEHIKFPHIYVYENLDATKDDYIGKASQIKITAKYNGVENIFITYINAQTTGGVGADATASTTDDVAENQFKIKRNNDYSIFGTIKRMGDHLALIMETKVSPWNYVDASYIFPRITWKVENWENLKTLLNCTFTPSPVEGDEDIFKSCTLEEKNNKLEIKFKVLTPESHKWEAHLSNTEDFELLYTDPSGNPLEPGTIIIQPTKDAGPERDTEFYITVVRQDNALPGTIEEPVEIDFNNNKATGEGNRLKIIQPAKP